MQPVTIYETLFWIGALGVVAMGAMGSAGHGAHAGRSGGHAGHVGHGSAHSGHGGHAGHSAHGHNVATRAGNGPGRQDAFDNAGNAAASLSVVMSLFSPLTIFSVSLGAGATGLLLRSRFDVTLTALLAALAGIALFALIVRPYMAFVQRFVSKPATALAGTLAREAVSQNGFDPQGRGIVTVTVDGQLVRLLAYLESDDVTKGTVVAPGERLVVTQIDEAKNTCRVTKL